MSDFTLHHGDCIAVMRGMADNSVDAIVTDPPYHLTTGKKGGSGPASVNLDSPAGRARVSTGFMGMEWDGGDIAQSVELWTEAMRVLRPGGHLLAFAGSRTYHRMACAIEEAGFEIRDQIMWLYAQGFPKSQNVGKALAKDGGNDEWEGWGTALKPAHEPICMARKPFKGTVAANVLAHGTGALNIDACRVEYVTVDGGSLATNPHLRSHINGGNGGHVIAHEAERRVVIPNAQGRWPANVIHDGSDELLAEFAQYGSKGAAAPVHQRGADKFRNAYGTFKGSEDEQGSTFYADTGSAARFFYCAKASRADRDEGLDDFALREAGIKNEGGRGYSESDPYAKVMRRNTHPTVKPVALMAYLVKLVTPPGGVVLDPFMGSGSTGKACMAEGFDFIGIDLSDEYLAIAEARIGHAQRKKATAAAAAPVAAQIDLFEE